MHPNVIDLQTGIRIANEAGLDLVEIDSKSTIAVCKVMCFSKHKYDQKKKQQGFKKQQKSSQTKIIKFRYNIDLNDLDFKIKNAIKFLKKNHRVEVILFFRGREIQHLDIGKEKILKFRDDCSVEFSKLESSINNEKRKISLLLVPKDV